MTIKVFLNTRHVDYAGYKFLPPNVEIRDQCLKLHCYGKFSNELIQLLNLDKINGVKQRIGIWYLFAKQ